MHLLTSNLGGWQNVINGNGINITIFGILIVFFSLSIITLFITCIPFFLKVIERFFPVEEDPVAGKNKNTSDAEIVAAIGLAFSHSVHLTNKQ